MSVDAPAQDSTTSTSNNEAAPVPQIITPVPEPTEASSEPKSSITADEVAAVTALEERDDTKLVAAEKAVDAALAKEGESGSVAAEGSDAITTAAPAVAVAAEEDNKKTDEVVADQQQQQDTLKAEEHASPSKTPKRSTSPLGFVKGLFGNNKSAAHHHKTGKVEVGSFDLLIRSFLDTPARERSRRESSLILTIPSVISPSTLYKPYSSFVLRTTHNLPARLCDLLLFPSLWMGFVPYSGISRLKKRRRRKLPPPPLLPRR
jgi:hypothetical protein